VTHDALKVICNKNLECPHKSGDIGSLGDMGTGRISAKNREIVKVFSSDISKFGDIGPAISGLPCTVMFFFNI
jgi:hypothetical protein